MSLYSLAIENELLKGHFEGESHLFVYRNRPSLVMGRFQVPWREISFVRLYEVEKLLGEKINIVRRRSGGGTVYHDLGNWNFCFIHRSREIHRNENLKIICDFMSGLGFPIEANERYDLIFDGGDKGFFKVSGSAFKQKKDTSLHHGTLLMQANLKGLKGTLGHPMNWEVSGHGVKSHPSPVINLGEIKVAPEFKDWITQWQSFLGLEGKSWSEAELSEAIITERTELQSWDWLWGECPRFEVNISDNNSRGLLLGFYKGHCEKAEYNGQTLGELIGKPLLGGVNSIALHLSFNDTLQKNLDYFFGV